MIKGISHASADLENAQVAERTAKAAEVAKSAYKQGRPIIDVAEEMTDIPRAELEKILES